VSTRARHHNGRRRSLTRIFERPYVRDGVAGVRRGLTAQLGLGFLIGLIGALLTLLYTPSLTGADLVVIILASWLIYLVDAALAVKPLRRALAPLEEWSQKRDETTARDAWNALAGLPFVPLRRRVTYGAVTLAIVLWDIVGVRRLGLSTTSFLLSSQARTWSGSTGSHSASS
jgi:hypothetical protein